MIRFRFIPAAALASALFVLAPSVADAGQHRTAESPRSGSAAIAALENFLGSLWNTAAAALGLTEPPQAGESADPAPRGDEGSSLDPHG